MGVLERLEDVLEVRRGSFLDTGRVFSVRRGAQRRAQRQFPRQGSCFQRAPLNCFKRNCKISLAKPLLLDETFETFRFWTNKVSQNVNTFEKMISKVTKTDVFLKVAC